MRENAPHYNLQISRFENVDKVVADDIRFKLKLGIGSDAYKSMKVGKRLQELWDVGGVAATGGTAAASSLVATTFFAPTGWLAAIGLGGAAITPVGWIVAAATVSGAAYYGVTRLFRGYAEDRIQTIPRFINTPIDLLGANLVDLIAPLAVKIAQIDADYDPRERAVIVSYFTDEWGLDLDYTKAAIKTIEENMTDQKLDALVVALAEFKTQNPDCNYDHMCSGLMTFLREVAEADNRLDERETMALERIETFLRSSGRRSLNSVLRSVGFSKT